MGRLPKQPDRREKWIEWNCINILILKSAISSYALGMEGSSGPQSNNHLIEMPAIGYLANEKLCGDLDHVNGNDASIHFGPGKQEKEELTCDDIILQFMWGAGIKDPSTPKA
ncbi:Phosphatidylserine decarboxylase proenzyme [Frankliniella fusca]|uniref:Phosphatidylserine decarboxylase proenzyme n=1 Tax=Frankliniella fusca TaxID=407009 RepID=A0AAE1H8W0_9NEOP|nr:Phosphatidylserine decarboxylase proenzyme [Frankliniella fusca]